MIPVGIFCLHTGISTLLIPFFCLNFYYIPNRLIGKSYHLSLDMQIKIKESLNDSRCLSSEHHPREKEQQSKNLIVEHDSYIMIFRWMQRPVEENGLELKGGKLTVYAILYGFTRDNNSNGITFGGQEYIAKLAGLTEHRVQHLLKELEEEELVIIERSGEMFKDCTYKAVRPDFTKFPPQENVKKEIPAPVPTVKQKKENKIDTYMSLIQNESEEWQDGIRTWLEYKKGRGQQYATTDSFLKFHEQQKKLMDNNPTILIEGINNSIANNYAGLFRPREKKEFKPYKHPNDRPEITQKHGTSWYLTEGWKFDEELFDASGYHNGCHYYIHETTGEIRNLAHGAGNGSIEAKEGVGYYFPTTEEEYNKVRNHYIKK